MYTDFNVDGSNVNGVMQEIKKEIERLSQHESSENLNCEGLSSDEEIEAFIEESKRRIENDRVLIKKIEDLSKYYDDLMEVIR